MQRGNITQTTKAYETNRVNFHATKPARLAPFILWFMNTIKVIRWWHLTRSPVHSTAVCHMHVYYCTLHHHHHHHHHHQQQQQLQQHCPVQVKSLQYICSNNDNGHSIFD